MTTFFVSQSFSTTEPLSQQRLDCRFASIRELLSYYEGRASGMPRGYTVSVVVRAPSPREARTFFRLVVGSAMRASGLGSGTSEPMQPVPHVRTLTARKGIRRARALAGV